ncbi:MAG: OmpA family protein [Bacteroidetes bacterium]|nr:OmpA family protein [Bacteroidota bacterium]
MRKFTLTLGMAAMLPVMASAQRYLGVATSNWSGTNSLYLNPANIADSRHKFTIDLFSVNVGVDNNLAKIDPLNVFSKARDGKDIKDITSGFQYNTKDKFSIMMPAAEVRGPGFMVSIGSKHSIALTTRVRLMNQFDNLNQQLFRTIVDSTFNVNGQSLKAAKFNWTAQLWSEIGLSYAAVIWENKQHQVKGGFTARYMMGAGYVSLVSNNLDATYTYDQQNGAILNLQKTDVHYRYGGANFFNGGGNSVITDNLVSNSGKGIGGDLGVVYEFRPHYKSYTYDMDGKTGIVDRSKNQYLLRFSAAVTDIGAIKYTNGNKQININGTGKIVGNDVADKINNYDDFRGYLAQQGIKADSSTGQSTKVALPTALILGLDYHAWKNFYVNATYMGNVVDRTKVGNSIYSQVTVTPRFDIRTVSVGLPITYSMLTSSIKAGIGIRVAGFFIGSDDIAGVLSNKANGVNFYMGAYVPFNKKKPKDSDGDLVSNRKDKCKGVKGVWELRGCPNPDKDGDGILDKDDKCPEVAGSKTAMGCPDADLDSVADAEDRCPQEAGLVSLQGCPDRDNDGVADIDDACPDVPGQAQYKGCPDTDGDGLADNEDACPNAAGPIANHGCPDTDNDGVPDNTDKCPTVPGTVANQGCPEVSVEVKKRLAFAATAIQFETGKATIKKTSYKLLNEIVKILNDYPDYMMTIDGHTDNVGKPEKNMQLSKDRAQSVKNYFVSKGISEDRLVTNGYGDTKPVASNKTAKGRAQNRRVAMDLKLKD